MKKRKSIFICEQKRFALLFLVVALCIHRQVCQCYAGGGGTSGRRNQSLQPTTTKSTTAVITNLTRLHQSYPSLRNSNSREIGTRGDSGRRTFDFRLRQASIVTSIEDDEGDVKGLSVRGGNIPEEERVDDVTIENVESISSSHIDSSGAIGHKSNLEQAAFLESSTGGDVDHFKMNTDIDGQSFKIEEINTVIENIDIVQDDKHDTTQKEIEELESNHGARMWPCGDKLDRELIRIALPCIANFAINPLVGAVDLFWINRTGNTLAVAGQAAANQIFSSSFWLTSFLPSGEYTRNMQTVDYETYKFWMTINLILISSPIQSVIYE